MTDAPNQHIVADNKSLIVKLWDLGPKKPTPPAKPQTPTGKDGDPTFELAKVEFGEVLERYVADLKRYRDDKAAFEKWHKDIGGPVQLERYSVDAADAKARDPERYVDKLPRGAKPGHAHHRELERQDKIAADHARARDHDPHFGKPAEGVPA